MPDRGKPEFICRPCAEFVIDIIDQELSRRGNKPVETSMSQLTMDMINISTKALEHFEALSRHRELTEIELERKRKVEAELERLTSEGSWGGSAEP